MRNCKKCSNKFSPRAYNHYYCSTLCKDTRNCKPIIVKSCKICDSNFNTNRSDRLYCSDECRENNIEKRISRNLRNRIWYAVNEYKAGSAIKDLGCTAEELKAHLESKFDHNMNWDNYGDWHIDHVKPLVSFDLTNREEFKKACHYTNLQPLWAEDNLIKGGKDA